MYTRVLVSSWQDHNIMHVHVLMRDEKEGTKKEDTSKQGQTNNKAKQHSIPKAVTFPKKNELGPEAMTLDILHSRQSALPAKIPRQFSWLGPTPNLACTMYIHVH